MGMYALAAFAGVQLIYSLVMPYIIKAIKLKTTYFISQILAAGCFIAFLFLSGQQLIILTIILTRYMDLCSVNCISLVAINFTSFNSIPFGLGIIC
jgi:hypothetical protein